MQNVGFLMTRHIYFCRFIIIIIAATPPSKGRTASFILFFLSSFLCSFGLFGSPALVIGCNVLFAKSDPVFLGRAFEFTKLDLLILGLIGYVFFLQKISL